MINIERISAKLSRLSIEELAWQSGFNLRNSGKVTATDFVLGFLQMLSSGTNTLLAWASHISLLSGYPLSLSGLQKKLQFRHIKFCEGLLDKALHAQWQRDAWQEKCKGAFSSFANVILEDSSCFKLPGTLFDFFPGSKNKHGHGATARIQLRLNLLKGAYEKICLQSFRDNDQKYASDIVAQLSAKDLVIRDMGYFALPVFRQIIEAGAFFLSRLKYKTHILDPESGEAIDLLKKLRSLRRQGIDILDIRVLVGKKDKVPARLVAVKAPQQVEQARKRKANKNRSAKANHSKKYMEFLGWTILITNVQEDVWTPRKAMQAYGVRWYIEIIFKCWKSGLGVQKLFEGKQSLTPPRAIITFYLALACLTILYAPLLQYFSIRVYQAYNKWVSPLKFAKFFRTALFDILEAPSLDRFLEHVARYCVYSERDDRKSMMECIYMLI